MFVNYMLFISCSHVTITSIPLVYHHCCGMPAQLKNHITVVSLLSTRVGNLIVATIYLQLIQSRYMFRSFIVLHCSHQHCVQPVASDVEVVGYL